MPPPRPQKNLADYVAIAIGPALIMALIISLVFFLLEVLYLGKYEGRLQWIFFFFIFGTVLIARVSMEPGISERAPLYGIALGLATWLTLAAFVEFPPGTPLAGLSWAIYPLLIALIWWCAHRLTWDCTWIDDAVEASGAGLLEAAGLKPGATEEPQGKIKKEKKPAEGPAGWWARYRTYRDKQSKRPRNPGVWVIYFSLAALPIFGLGQSLIPPEDEARRRYAFWLMGVYVASGLGLLLTTCFLGVRRYLRQRKVQMPGEVTRAWLVLGGLLVVGLLLAGAFLPRPSAEYPLVDLGPLARSSDRDASDYAIKDDSPGKGEGRGSPDQRPDEKNPQPGSGGNRDEQGNPQNGGQSGQGGSQGGQGGQSQGNQSGSKSPGESGQKGSSDSQQQPGQQGDQRQQNQQGNRGDRKDGKPGSQSGAGARSGGARERTQGRRSAGSRAGSSSRGRSILPPFLHNLFSTVGPVLKWLIFAVLALVVGFIVVRAVLKSLANFTVWAARLLAAWESFWRWLFGDRGGAAADAGEQAPEPKLRHRPFAWYQNPFHGGAGRFCSTEELLQYSFEALEAWAAEHDIGRQPDETPLEFTTRLGREFPALDDSARRLAALYVRAAYGGARLAGDATGPVRQFWVQLERFVEAPLSA